MRRAVRDADAEAEPPARDFMHHRRALREIGRLDEAASYAEQGYAKALRDLSNGLGDKLAAKDAAAPTLQQLLAAGGADLFA